MGTWHPWTVRYSGVGVVVVAVTTLVTLDRNLVRDSGDGGWTTTVHVPQRVPLASRAVLVACGSESSHAIDAEGRLWSWGWCEHGNLGNVGAVAKQCLGIH